jgi:hypothetical protein
MVEYISREEIIQKMKDSLDEMTNEDLADLYNREFAEKSIGYDDFFVGEL